MAKPIEKKDFTIGQRLFNMAISAVSDIIQTDKKGYSTLRALKGIGKGLTSLVGSVIYVPLRTVGNIVDKGIRLAQAGKGAAAEHAAFAEDVVGMPASKPKKINTAHNRIIPKKGWAKQVLENRKARKNKKSKGIAD